VGSLACCRIRAANAGEIAHLSTAWSSFDPRGGYEAELVIATPRDEAILLGAFQRSSEVAVSSGAGLPTYRRGSGGAAARVGRGSVWLRLALARPDALVPCDAEKLLNRYVRPLLRALTKSGAPAHYFGRDWISVAHRPAAMVAFAHNATTGRASFEAIVAVTTSFALSAARASYLEKAPTTLEETAGKSDVERIADAIEEAYCALADHTMFVSPGYIPAPPVTDEPAWSASCEEALGTIGAGRDSTGVMRIGGELMASCDAVARLEARLATAPVGDIGEAIDEAFAPPAVIFGVRTLTSIRDVVLEAWGS
jgi:hypothetical protein